MRILLGLVCALLMPLSVMSESLCVRRGAVRLFTQAKCPNGWAAFAASVLGTSVVGPQGVPGPQGPQGPQGAPGISPRGEVTPPAEVRLTPAAPCAVVDLRTLCADGDGCGVVVTGKVAQAEKAGDIYTPEVREAKVMLGAMENSGRIAWLSRDLTTTTPNDSGVRRTFLNTSQALSLWSIILDGFDVAGVGTVGFFNFVPSACPGGSGVPFSGANAYMIAVQLNLTSPLVTNADVLVSFYDR